MRPAVTNDVCRLRLPQNCAWCRSREDWRRGMLVPDICPHGITAKSIPTGQAFIDAIAKERGFRVKMHRIMPDGSRCSPCGATVIVFREEQK